MNDDFPLNQQQHKKLKRMNCFSTFRITYTILKFSSQSLTEIQRVHLEKLPYFNENNKLYLINCASKLKHL